MYVCAIAARSTHPWTRPGTGMPARYSGRSQRLKTSSAWSRLVVCRSQ